MAIVTAVCVALDSDQQRFLYPLLAIGFALAIRPRAALSFVAALSISGAAAAGLTTGSPADALYFGFAAFIAGVSMHLIARLVATLRALAASRRRLADADAAEHARAIEEIGRDALGRVRRTVAGYRRTTLRDELRSAADALAAAGVETRADAPPDLPPEVDDALACVVREGTTNILRHARASRCDITIAAGTREVTIEVADDGRASAATGAGTGTGIAGLRERIAAVGGILVADARTHGFRLSATVPRREDRT